MNYEYWTIRVARGTWPQVIEQAHAIPSLFGLWRGQIGWHDDEGVMLTSGPARELDHVVEGSFERLEATVRPVDATPPTQAGTYAHRWFELDAADWPEFLELSAGAWPAFEAAYDAQIIGFWRSLEAPSGTARVLLITRYPSLQAWQESRALGDEDSRAKFLRRHELTRRTIVRIGALV